MKKEIRRFTGGITDYIQTENEESFELLDNLLITKDRDLESRFGSRLLDEVNNRPVTLVDRPSKIIKRNNTVFTIYGSEILYYENDTWGNLSGVNTSNVLNNGDIDTRVSVGQWNEHVLLTDSKYSNPVKIYADENGDTQIVNLGLPAPEDTFVITPLADEGKTYIYSFLYRRNYRVGEAQFLDASAVVQKQITNGSATQNDITGIPVLVNTSDTNYDIANVVVEIYRTADNGESSQKVGEVANGVTSFSDTTTDANLNGITLYTEAGVPNNEQPPNAKYIEIVDNAAFYANSSEYPYRVWQSQAGDPDSVPANYFVDFESEIIGLSSYQSNLIVFTTNQIWRVEGTIDLFGGGFQRKVLIAESATTLHNDSIVKTDQAVFFAGLDGFYKTNGYEIKPIPDEDRDFYRRYKLIANNPNDIQGAFDNIEQRIYWCTKSSATNYITYVFDVTFNAFTTMSGLSGSFDTVALSFDSDGNMYRGNVNGYLFIHTNSELIGDPIVEPMKLKSQWQFHPVIYTLRHVDYTFGYPDLNKWVTKCSFIGDGRTDLDFEIRSYDDSYDIATTMKPISFSSGMVWEDEDWVWEDNADIWQLELRMNQIRRFKRGSLRCKTKQIEITNSITTLRESSPLQPTQQVSVNATTKVVTILNPLEISLPQNVINKSLVIGSNEYKIVEAGTDSVRVEDTLNTLVNGNFDWKITGFAHNQQFHLSSFSYDFTLLDDDGGYFKAGGSGN